MKSQRIRRTAFAATFVTLAALLVLLGSKLVVKAQDASSLSVVYLESDISTTNGNTVLGFSNDGNGNLTALPNSPYLTGGTGIVETGNGNQLDADGEVIANPEGTLLFAVNEHSNTIAIFNINIDGSLMAAPGSPVPSNGTAPASLGLKDNVLPGNVSLLVVMNKDSDVNQTQTMPNYSTFDVQSNGAMTLNAGSTFPLAAGSSPGSVLPFIGQNKFFGIGFLANTITSYGMNPSGVISQISSSTPPGSAPVTLGAALDPVRNALYVGLPAQAQIAAYEFDHTGNLTFLTEVADPGTAVCWLAVNSAGTRLYAAETGTGTVTVYNINAPGNPVQLQHFTLAMNNGKQAVPKNLAFDPTGKFLYVLDNDNALHVLHVAAHSGSLSEPTNPVRLGLPVGTAPVGLAALSIP